MSYEVKARSAHKGAGGSISPTNPLNAIQSSPAPGLIQVISSSLRAGSLLLAFLLALPFPLAALADDSAGQTLAAESRSSVPPAESETHGVFVIKSGDKKTEIPVVCQIKVHPGTWDTIYQTPGTASVPAERLVITHSANGPNQYFYARASQPGAPLPALAPVSGAALDTPFVGSDFSLGELGLEFLHWPGQRQLLPNERRSGRPCYVLESTGPAAGGIVRLRSSIDEEGRVPLYAEAYDAAGKLVERFYVDSVTKDAQGQVQLKEMEIVNKKTDSKTDVKFDIPKK